MREKVSCVKGVPRTFVAGAEKRSRTSNLLFTKQLLCRLSYLGVVGSQGFEPWKAQGQQIYSLPSLTA